MLVQHTHYRNDNEMLGELHIFRSDAQHILSINSATPPGLVQLITGTSYIGWKEGEKKPFTTNVLTV